MCNRYQAKQLRADGASPNPDRRDPWIDSYHAHTDLLGEMTCSEPSFSSRSDLASRLRPLLGIGVLLETHDLSITQKPNVGELCVDASPCFIFPV